jgi:hypothetical protein
MKRLFLIVLAIIMYNLSDAQIKVNSNGWVTIGSTSSATKPLDVRGNVVFTAEPSCGSSCRLIIEKGGWYYTSAVLRPYYNYSGNLGISTKAFAEVYTYNLEELSDVRQKENIKDIDNALDIVLNLKGIRYDLKKEIIYQDRSIIDPKIIEKLEKARKDRIGFIAQDVVKILPEVVTYDDSSDIYSIGYTKIIPVLVEAIKEQQSQIEKQQAEIEELKSEDSKAKSTAENNLDITQLFQNHPNPFNENTVIDYYIPEGNQKAVIYIYDLNGSQKKAYNITTKSNSSIVINGSELQPGMYLYTLIVDGREIDTKRMILTE